ncbi:putative RNA-directed DNA polymerase, partial [Tanacetum coccineum]
MASGLKININKSKLMGYGVHFDEVEIAARHIRCATFVAPFTHLGVKVGGRMDRTNSWDDVVSKWKLKTLSIGGRLTLIKSDGFKETARVPSKNDNEQSLLKHVNLSARAVVAIPLEAVKEVSSCFDNTLYGYFVGKCLAFPLVENYVKNTWIKYGLERVMNKNGFFFFKFSTRDGEERGDKDGSCVGEIASCAGWLSFKCQLMQHCLNQLLLPFRFLMVRDILWRRLMLNMNGRPQGIVLAIFFYHNHDQCPKKPKEVVTIQEDKDGFVEVKKKKKAKAPTKPKQIGGVRLSKPMPNYYYRHVEHGEMSKDAGNNDKEIASQKPPKDKEVVMKNSFKALIDDETLGMSNETTWIHAKQSLNVINGSDSKEVDQGLNLSPKQSEVRHVIHKNNLSLFVVLESYVASSRLERLCAIVFRHWNWTSNGNWCSKGTHIILGWNSNLADVTVIDQMDQAMHVRVWIKMDKNELFCSLCILGDFNAALYLEDSTAGSSRFDISIREFKECVEEIEVMDVVRMGLQFTWNQKPKGNDGILKKINHIMTNLWKLGIHDTFLGAHAIFKFPIRIQDPSRIEAVMESDGTLLTNDQVAAGFVKHYEDFLGQAGHTGVFNMDGLFRNVLDNETVVHMVRAVSVNEDIAANDITRAVQEFFQNGTLLKELNHTIIALIPKVNTPNRINDYRPISCCNVLFKCISKIISNRIKGSLNDLISPNQSAFVPGRRISDNILLTQELMHNYHLDRGAPRCAFKVDIQKAYDTVDWDFLKLTLGAFGFHPRMVAWIMECVTSTSFSICINGSLHGYFKGKRCLRQGDPLSPYLFTLIMEVLTLMLHRRVRDSERYTYHRYCSKLELINLCFADDLFLFAHGDVHSAKVIMESLDEFKFASGLTPSLPKSTAYFCNVLNHVKIAILHVLPFEEGQLSVKYLGVPLVSSRLVYRDCRELIEKVRGRINDWKNKSLSAAGRLQLIRSVLGLLKRGRAKVLWDLVCRPCNEGGLGIRRIDLFNKALMVSHLWNLISLKDSLWVKWIHTYKLKGHSFWDVPCRGNMTWGWRKVLQLRPLIREFIWYRIRDGLMASAWFDTWCHIGPLSNIVTTRDIFRAGFDLSTKVNELIVNGSWAWPQEWYLKYPMLCLIVPSIISSSCDKLEWRTSAGLVKPFTVSNVWECIRTHYDAVTWHDVVWFPNCVPRYSFLLWLVIHGRLKTQDLLRHWDVNVALVASCPLCEGQSDSHSHLFFECGFSTQVWNQMKGLAGLS